MTEDDLIEVLSCVGQVFADTPEVTDPYDRLHGAFHATINEWLVARGVEEYGPAGEALLAKLLAKPMMEDFKQS